MAFACTECRAQPTLMDFEMVFISKVVTHQIRISNLTNPSSMILEVNYRYSS